MRAYNLSSLSFVIKEKATVAAGTESPSVKITSDSTSSGLGGIYCLVLLPASGA